MRWPRPPWRRAASRPRERASPICASSPGGSRARKARCSPSPARWCSGIRVTASAALCGGRALSEEAGHMRRCTDPACKAMHFPRTDPAVDHTGQRRRAGAARPQRNFPPGMYSATLAPALSSRARASKTRSPASARGDRDRGQRRHLPLVAALAVSRPASCHPGFHAEATTERDLHRRLRRALKTPNGSKHRLAPRRTPTTIPSSLHHGSIRSARRLVEDWLHRRAGPGQQRDESGEALGRFRIGIISKPIKKIAPISSITSLNVSTSASRSTMRPSSAAGARGEMRVEQLVWSVEEMLHRRPRRVDARSAVPVKCSRSFITVPSAARPIARRCIRV